MLSLALDPFTRGRIILSVLVNATVETRLVVCVAKSVLLPADAAAYLCRSMPRPEIISTSGSGDSPSGPSSATRFPRRLVARHSRGALRVDAEGGGPGAGGARGHFSAAEPGGRSTDGSPESGRGPGWGRVRRSLGEIWHLLAILYIVGIYLIYALRIEGGFGYVLRATALSLIVIVAAQLLVRFVQGLSRRGFSIKPELKAQFPTLEQRANRYVPILTGLTGGVSYILAATDGAAGLERRSLRLVRLPISAGEWPETRCRSAWCSSLRSPYGKSAPAR